MGKRVREELNISCDASNCWSRNNSDRVESYDPEYAVDNAEMEVREYCDTCWENRHFDGHCDVCERYTEDACLNVGETEICMLCIKEVVESTSEPFCEATATWLMQDYYDRRYFGERAFDPEPETPLEKDECGEIIHKLPDLEAAITAYIEKKNEREEAESKRSKAVYDAAKTYLTELGVRHEDLLIEAVGTSLVGKTPLELLNMYLGVN